MQPDWLQFTAETVNKAYFYAVLYDRRESWPESTFAESAEKNIPLNSLTRAISAVTAEHTYPSELSPPATASKDALQHRKL